MYIIFCVLIYLLRKNLSLNDIISRSDASEITYSTCLTIEENERG